MTLPAINPTTTGSGTEDAGAEKETPAWTTELDQS